MKEAIKDFGKTIGWVETKQNGDKVAQDFYGRILGYYKKNLNITTDFYGRTLSRNDSAESLVWKEYWKNQK